MNSLKSIHHLLDEMNTTVSFLLDNYTVSIYIKHIQYILSLHLLLSEWTTQNIK